MKSEYDDRMSTKYPMWKSTRMVIIVVTFLGMFVFTLTRGIISFAMVCMVNATAVALLEPESLEAKMELFNRSIERGCPVSSTQWHREYDGEFVWTTKEQSFIFAALSWGELLADIPSGYFVHHYGPKRALFIGGLVTAIATLLTPLAATYGSIAVVAMRFIVGFSFATLWPVKSAIVSMWTHKEERSTAISLVTCGNQLSTVVAMPLGALLCENTGFFGGWPAIFYLTGIGTLLWLVIWLLLVKDTPQTHQWISEGERHYLTGGKTAPSGKSTKVPTLKLLRTHAVLATILCQAAATWGIFSLLYYLPRYLRDVMLVDLRKNGIFSALPFLSQFILRIVFGMLADHLERRKKINRTVLMKTFNTIGFFSLGSLIFGSTFLDCRKTTLYIVLMCIGMGLWATVVAGYVTSAIIIAPKYASVISSWSKFFGTSLSIILPYVQGAIVYTGSQVNWQIFFGMSLLVLFLSGFCFLIWGSGQELNFDTKVASKGRIGDSNTNA